MSRTRGIESYLEAVYILESEGEEPLPSKVADYLSVARPTVTQTMQRLTALGLVEAGDSKPISLTEEGRRRAEAMVRRHRLLERWLTDHLGLDWADAHVEAERLEHSISPMVETRLFELLGRPTTCPHGNLIPGTGASKVAGIPITDLEPGEEAVVVRIMELAEEDLNLLRYFHQSGVVPGALVTMEQPASPYDVGITLVTRQHPGATPQYASLNPQVARRVMVKKQTAE
ncbi:metal-dependent transcriptional regulator [Alicyclobacillus tolerans]|uniref:Manganese transport regulator n=1 Tax=Alicyclobacillus tolerans TaxID=90970 RepID=A0ABT9LSQ9_9BACL|nr:metal-dependent transcriptional regulator [Alicyclobacillus tengchongensis]MDP9727300.1 DtxR family Mn-dependent transcriptional regulator [Alicyclobacillus tengchongensis]